MGQSSTRHACSSQPEQNDQESSPTPSARLLAQRLRPLWPLILGLAFGRAGLIVSCYGSYLQTDEGLFSDGSMLVALAAMLVAFSFMTARKATLSKKTVNRIMRVCIALEVATIASLSIMDFMEADNFALRFFLCSSCTLVSSFAIFYWLRRARETSTTTAAVFVFSALALSEVTLYLASFMPLWASNLFAAALALVQYPCMIWARKQTQPHRINTPTEPSDYFAFTGSMIKNVQFLIVTAGGIASLSIVIGLLRGYPDGAPVPFTYATRAAYALITIGFSIAIIMLVLHERKRILTVGIFVVMESLACLALVAYAAFPSMLEIGAVFTTTLNALMVAFTWYIIIAFMSYGWRDPYYYAMAGWFVWLGSRAVARIALLMLYGVAKNDSLMQAIMSMLVVASTQLVFMQFLKIARGTHDACDQSDQEETPSSSTITRIMGLDSSDNLAAMRQTSMRHSAEEVGRQFLLSEREVDVLALYALGFTQKRVAEELYISPGTAHAHIKRIYAKTGMHSRQEILDYIGQYAS